MPKYIDAERLKDCFREKYEHGDVFDEIIDMQPAVEIRDDSHDKLKITIEKSDAKRYCPISVFGGNRFAQLECIEMDCMWWRAYAQDCSVPLIADILTDSSINQIIFKNEEE